MSAVPPSGPNPYASPDMSSMPAGTAYAPAGPLPTSMEYMRSYHYIFENPNWLTTVLLMGVLFIPAMIPGVGIVLNLLFIGYQFEVIDGLMRSGGRQYPDFEFGRIGDYFGRGLWPFLVSLIGSFALGAVLVVGMLVFGGVATAVEAIGGKDADSAIAPVGGFIVLLSFAVIMVVASFLLVAMLLKSGLAQDFVAGFDFPWIFDFLKKMWVDMIVAGLFLGATGFVLEMLGVCAACIGLLFVFPIILMAYAHLLFQLYAVYLARGGIPVLVKPQAVYMPPPPSYPSQPT
jgi:uncharacterized protein DUF4013